MAFSRDIELNSRIRDPQVRVIAADGSQLGIMTSYEAFRLAESQGLDLVKINPTAQPPVCKIMDYGKFKFDTLKREKELRRSQRSSEMKEMWLSMNIDSHDLETKARQVSKFLSSGDKVKVSIRMRGREQAHSAVGIDVMNRFFAIVENVGTIDRKPTVDGRNIIMILVPKKEPEKRTT